MQRHPNDMCSKRKSNNANIIEHRKELCLLHFYVYTHLNACIISISKDENEDNLKISFNRKLIMRIE